MCVLNHRIVYLKHTQIFFFQLYIKKDGEEERINSRTPGRREGGKEGKEWWRKEGRESKLVSKEEVKMAINSEGGLLAVVTSEHTGKTLHTLG